MIHNLLDLSNFIRDEQKNHKFKQIVILYYFQTHFDVENENIVEWFKFCQAHFDINENVKKYLLSTLTPFQKYYLSIVSKYTKYPTVYRIPKAQAKIITNQSQYRTQYKKYMEEKSADSRQEFFLMYDEEFKKLWLIISLEYKVEIFTMDEQFIYFCFHDVYNHQCSSSFERFITLGHHLERLDNYKFELCADNNDYFVYYLYKPFTKCIMKGIPTLLGNFIAAEKLQYHKVFKENDIMHPSTTVLYGIDFYNKMIAQQDFFKQVFSIQQLSSRGQKYPRRQDKKIIKIPFSSSSRSIELGSDLKKLFDDYFVEYGCIVQNVNLYDIEKRINIHYLATYEIRCFVVDGKVLCGVQLFRGNKIRLFDVIYDEKGEAIIQVNEQFTVAMDKLKQQQASKSEWLRAKIIKKNEDGTYNIKYSNNVVEHNVESQFIRFSNDDIISVKSKYKKNSEFVSSCMELIQHRYSEILSLAERAFHLFNSIQITEELPRSVSNFPLETDSDIPLHTELKQKKKRKEYPENRLDNLQLIQKFLSEPSNYLNRRFHERFLRIDIMYWNDLDRFYVNEVETFACGKLESASNNNIFSLIYSHLI